MNGYIKYGISITTEYYLVRKRNEVQIYATTWKNLKTLMLGERSQMPNITHGSSPVI